MPPSFVGDVVGLVTLEDALEQLVGESEDEFDARPEPEPAVPWAP